VKHNVKARGLDYLIEGIGLRNIWDNDDRQLGIGMRLADFGGLVLGPNSGDYLVSSLDEKLEDVGWRKLSVRGIGTSHNCTYRQ
jgi:hypothetical protein